MALYCATPHYRMIKPVTPQTNKTPSKPYRTRINIQALAEIHFDNYDFDLSLAVYHELCVLSPQVHMPHIYFNIAQIHLHLGERHESESWFLKAVTIDPYFAVAFLQLGVLNAALGNIRRAHGFFTACRNAVVRSGSAENADITYDQVGMRYILRVADIDANIALCAMVHAASQVGREHEWSRLQQTSPKAVVMVPGGTLFRVQVRKIRARAQDPAKTAEWRFRDEARVVAIASEEDERKNTPKGRRRKKFNFLGSPLKKAW